ncbi:MAG TPA: rhomboid family intramembrane serine protease [Terracidiphilus sp.]|jgi:membrane associated rhomboid family serine protease|nr:rhomboid family intramembrane serine protease [Terracidiphilus sp.]
MPRLGSSPFAFPDFSGATRRLILINLGAFFALLVTQLALRAQAGDLAAALSLLPGAFVHGSLWQPLTYSFIHPTLLGTLFELLSLWFLAGFLETQGHSASWVIGLYAVSVLATAAAALAIYLAGGTLGYAVGGFALYGCFGGIFGLLAAIGLLYGDVEFLMFFLIGIKARYMVVIFALVSIAMLFGEQRMYAFAELGGALGGLLWVRTAPRRGISLMMSERWYGLRNRYYRWKRRRAARKFEVYMRRQGRTVRFDGQGRQIDEDHDDKSRWN